MDGEDKQELCQQLAQVDTYLMFLFLIVLSVLLSYWATVRQRDALCLTIQGEDEEARRAGDVYRLRLAASALIVGPLGFFFMQSLSAQANADPTDRAAGKSACLNVVAGFLVLAAALLRLLNLNFMRRTQSG